MPPPWRTVFTTASLTARTTSSTVSGASPTEIAAVRTMRRSSGCPCSSNGSHVASSGIGDSGSSGQVGSSVRYDELGCDAVGRSGEGVGAVGRLDHRRIEAGGVVGAQQAEARGFPERGVDEGLVPGALGELLCGATRPDRLADASRRAALGQQRQDEVGPRRDDPRRVASDRLHVGELQERVPRRKDPAEELEPVLRHHHQDGLARRQAAFDVRDGALQVLVVPRVEQRFVPERRGSNWYFGERAHGSLEATRGPAAYAYSRGCHDELVPLFAHGVGSFDPTSDHVLLWTRLGDGVTGSGPRRGARARAARRRPPLVASDGPRRGRHDHRRRGRSRAGHVLLVPVRGGR